MKKKKKSNDPKIKAEKLKTAMWKQVKERKAERDCKRHAPQSTAGVTRHCHSGRTGPQPLTQTLEHPRSSKNQRLRNNLAATPNMN